MPGKMLSAALVIIPVFFFSLIGWYLGLDYVAIMIYALAGILLGLICLRFLHWWLATEVYKIIGGVAGHCNWRRNWYAARPSGELYY